MFEAATHCDLVDEMMNWTSRMIGLRAGLWQGSRYTFHRRVHLHRDLEYTPRAGEVQFSVADAQWMNVEAWGIAVLGFRLARWGSPALHPRLSKSAVSPLQAKCEKETPHGLPPASRDITTGQSQLTTGPHHGAIALYWGKYFAKFGG
jgi:hypothetical protein